MIRKVFFWAHLAAGVLTSIVVLTMSVTGVLLTYERQMLAWSAKSHYVPEAEQTTPLPIEDLIQLGKLKNPDFTPSSFVIKNDPSAPITLAAGRAGGMALNPYTGEELEGASEGLENFFRSMTSFHRWFSITGEGRNTARAITGASNLIFLFLILSGMYLWLPRLWKWGIFKARLLLNTNTPNSKARDFNWHHVFGIWSAIPLAIVVATATVFSYGWANNLVYQAFGEEAPVRRGPPGGFGGPRGPQNATPVEVNAQFLNYDELFNSAKSYVNSEIGHWQQLSLNAPAPSSPSVQFSVDLGDGGQPQLRHSFTLNRETGALESWQPFSDQSPGQQARSIIRFLHTGEALGFWGQTIAGIVSFTSILMVWTGLALSYRRLIQPLFRRRTRG